MTVRVDENTVGVVIDSTYQGKGVEQAKRDLASVAGSVDEIFFKGKKSALEWEETTKKANAAVGASFRPIGSALGEVGNHLEQTSGKANKMSREFSKLGDITEYAGGGIKRFRGILEGMAFGGVIAAIAGVTGALISLYQESVVTEEQINNLNDAVMRQANGWKLLPEPMGAATDATVALYNAQLKYLQLLERDKGAGLEQQLRTLGQIKQTMIDSPEWAGFFGNSIEQLDVKIAAANVKLAEHKLLMELQPATADKVKSNFIGTSTGGSGSGGKGPGGPVGGVPPAMIFDDDINNMILGGDDLQKRLLGGGKSPSLNMPFGLNYSLAADTMGMDTALDEDKRKREEAAQQALGKLESPYGQPSVNGELPSMYQEYDGKLRALEEYNAKKLNLMSEGGASELEIEAAHAELSNQYAAKRRDFQIAAAGQTLGAMSNFMQNLYVATGSRNKAMFTAMKAVSIAEAIVNTATAATQAWKAPPGPPWSAAYVAAVIASGASQIATIARTEPGSGQGISAGGTAMPSYSGGSYDAYPVPQRTEQDTKARPQIVFKIEKMELLDEDSVDRLMARMSERVKDYDVTLEATR